MRLAGKSTLITGAARGIGLAIAKTYVAEGAKVAIADIDEARAHAAALSIGEGAIAVHMDVADQASIDAGVAATADAFGQIDVLINNAGVCLCSWAKQTPRDDAEMIMQTNFLGAVSVIRHAMPHLSQGANIINVGSIAGRIGIPFQSMYSASKAALMVYTDALRMETKGSGVRVSLIEPGDLRLQKGAASVVKSSGFESDPVADRAEKIMRAEEAAGTNPIKVVKAVVSAIKSSAPKNR